MMNIARSSIDHYMAPVLGGYTKYGHYGAIWIRGKGKKIRRQLGETGF